VTHPPRASAPRSGSPVEGVVMRARTRTHETLRQEGVSYEATFVARRTHRRQRHNRKARPPENDPPDDAPASAPPPGTRWIYPWGGLLGKPRPASGDRAPSPAAQGREDSARSTEGHDSPAVSIPQDIAQQRGTQPGSPEALTAPVAVRSSAQSPSPIRPPALTRRHT